MDNITGTQASRSGQHLTLVMLDADGKFLTLFSGAQFLTADRRLHAAAAEDAAAGRNVLTRLTEVLPQADWSVEKILSQLERYRAVDARGAVLALGVATGNDRDDFTDWDIWEASELTEWLEANPAWTSECGRPHPFGEYHIVLERDFDGRTHVEYLDADGKLHRTDGPAMIVDSQDRLRTESWYLHGANLTPAHLESSDWDGDRRWPDGLQPWQAARTIALDHDDVEVGAAYTDGDGHLHRADGPAVMDPYGAREWFRRGKQLYRTTSPGTHLVTTDGELVTDPDEGIG